MSKVLFVPFFSLLLFATGCTPKIQPLVDEDGTDYGALAGQYAENPAALRDYVQQCENTTRQLATTRQQLNDMQNQQGSTQGQMQAQMTQMQQENQTLRQQITELQNRRNDEVITDQPTVQGVIFQVQLGAYARNKVDPNMATEDALELQDQNGVQKVVVSQFRTYANAAALRDRLKQMGVNGAFVVAKNNGQRIEVQEALRMTGQG